MRLFGLVWVAACGRVGFEAAPRGDGGPGSDGGDATATAANRVFVTSASVAANFGGLAGADQKCATAATGAGLAGTFVAWLSATGVAARDRLGGASGWVRVDGAPVTLNVTDWLTLDRMFDPIATTEHGDPLAPSEPVWTGTRGDGTGPLFNCIDWSSAASNQSGVTGSSSGTVGDFSEYAVPSCTMTAHLYCFQIDHQATVAPSFVAGRLAFVTAGRRSATIGLPGLDQMCQTEADAAGLGRTFLAAAATTTTSIRSRFALDTRPWVRVDGTVIASPGTGLFGGPLQSFINQDARGNYLAASTFVWTGATNPDALGVDTCSDWTSVGGSAMGTTGRPGDADLAVLWGGVVAATCNNNGGHVLCLEN